MDDSRIGSKPAPFSFENGLVWAGPYLDFLHTVSEFLHTNEHPSCLIGTEVEQARPNIFALLLAKSRICALKAKSFP